MNGVGAGVSGAWYAKTMGDNGNAMRGMRKETSSRSSMRSTNIDNWVYSCSREAGRCISGGNVPILVSIRVAKTSMVGHV